jgi:apolipoprotein N-acyltransferase
VSAVIDATGTIVAATAMGEQKLLIGEVSIRQPPATLMVAWGDWVGRTAFVLLLLQALFWAGKALKRGKHSASPSPAATTAHAAFRAEAVALAPVWRIAAGLLRVFAFGSLFWIGAALLFQSEQMNPLAQMRMFAALFLAPLAAAWCIARAFAATARISRAKHWCWSSASDAPKSRLKRIAALEPWTLPLPSTGVWLRMDSGRRWSRGLALDDPAALVDALAHAGAPASVAEASTGRALAYARARLAVARHRLLDHPLVKFVLFPLVPALPAFRLHQHIAFGGTFGEYHTYGLQAYLTALGIWWASWAIGLVIFAAVLRDIIEAGTWLSLALRRESAIGIRSRARSSSAGFVYYVGVPVWLLIRFWPW